MRAISLNLAQRPFLNERPARRTTLLLWLLGLGLLGVNVYLYQRHLSGQHEQRLTAVDLEQRIASERASIRRLEEQLTQLDLRQQNRRVALLNAEIAKRTFSWSRLLDQLTEVLPGDVQLRRISPRVGGERRGRRTGAVERGREAVAIDLGGVARTSEAMLQLVDNLFGHASFAAPNLASERRREDGLFEFALDVLYLPSRPQPQRAEESQSPPSVGDPVAESLVTGPDDLAGLPPEDNASAGPPSAATQVSEP